MSKPMTTIKCIVGTRISDLYADESRIDCASIDGSCASGLFKLNDSVKTELSYLENPFLNTLD